MSMYMGYVTIKVTIMSMYMGYEGYHYEHYEHVHGI